MKNGTEICIGEEAFDEYMKSGGIDPKNLKNDAERLALPFAYGAWQQQQLVIGEMQRRIDRFKNAFEAL